MRVAAPADKRFRRAHVRPPRRRHSWARVLGIVRSVVALAVLASGAYVLQQQVTQARALHVKPEVMLAMVEAASRARFERQSGSLNSAINVVWLVTTTTVKGRPDYDLYLVSPPRWSDRMIGPRLPRKVTPAPAKSATEGGDGLAPEVMASGTAAAA